MKLVQIQPTSNTIILIHLTPFQKRLNVLSVKPFKDITNKCLGYILFFMYKNRTVTCGGRGGLNHIIIILEKY